MERNMRGVSLQGHDPSDLARGWHRTASKAVEDALISTIGEGSAALLHSQAGLFFSDRIVVHSY